ncbi:MAG: N-acetylmuramoyl-L-alanine amidase, partial [Candidatus Obscuribacterales bacterium]|nr:N-acetylmuramoyl-L-alanine amidase [Candidatus Obscuribacterales bacterium]
TEQSRALAGKIHEQLVQNLQVPDRNVRKARFYVVNHTEYPAILAEVGFISNKDERDKLISSDYQAKIAESLAQGVILFLSSSQEPASPALSRNEGSQNKTAYSGTESTNAVAKSGQNALKQIAVQSPKSGQAAADTIPMLSIKRIAQKGTAQRK